METEQVIQGRRLGPTDIRLIEHWLATEPHWNRTRLSRELGDDLYAHQPFCRWALLQLYHFLFVCKPDSHTHLYQWVNRLEPGRDRRTVTMRVKNKGHWETHTYRYANAVPLVEGDDGLHDAWLGDRPLPVCRDGTGSAPQPQDA